MNTLIHKRIFVVDDDPFWTSILFQMLTDLGYTNIISFSSGRECLNYLHLNPALIFLDYQMDDMNGLEVLQGIKAYYPNIGVVFCTAYEDLSVAVNAIEFGSHDYLLKRNANIKEVTSIMDNITKRPEFTKVPIA